MSKRRAFLIRILLIIVVIGCLTHTSWGQENDIVNITHPSSLPAKSEVTHEDILNQAQRSLDRSIDLFNTVATVMGVFGALITLIIILGGAFGYTEISRLKKLNEEAEEYVKQIENNAKDAEKIVDEAKEVVSDAKPVFDRLKQIDKNAKKSLDTFRERAKHLPSLSEPFSENQKKILDKYGKKIEFLEAFGVPLKHEDYFNRGVDFYQRAEYELALKAFDKAIELKPDDADAGYNRGVTLGKLGRHEEALKAFDKAIELKPDYAAAWNNRGNALDKLGRHEEALEAFDKAIELKPDDAYIWYGKACAYSLIGDKENALKNLSKAIDLDAKYKEEVKSDEDFKNLWDDEDFKRIVS